MAEKSSNVGSYGYIIVLSAFCIQVIGFGTARSVAVYNVEYITTFNVTALQVSLVGSINMGLFLGAGPVANALMSYLSHRQVALLGATLINIGLLCMPFASSILYVYVFYGLVTGLGYALVYIPSHVLSGLYFHKHKTLSTGLAAAGLGFGQVIFPIVINRLIHLYGWGGSFFIVTGINLHLFIFAALLRPIHKTTKESLFCLMEDMTFKVIAGGNNALDSKRLMTPSNTDEQIGKTSTLLIKDTPNDVTAMLLREEKVNDSPIPILKDNEPYENNTKQMALTVSNDYDHNHDTLKEQEPSSLYQRFLSHVRPLCTFYFLIYCVNNICWNAGETTIIIFLTEYITSIGLSPDEAAIDLSLLGVGTCIGSVVVGLLGNLRCTNRYLLYTFCNIGCGVVAYLFAIPVLRCRTGLFSMGLLFGYIYGNILGLLVVVTNDLVGPSALGDAFGCVMLTNGIGTLLGPPLAGAAIDSFKSPIPGIYIASCILIVGGLIMSLVPFHKYIMSKHRRETTIIIFLSEYIISIGLTPDEAAIDLSLLGVGTCIGSVVVGLLGNLRCTNRYLLYTFCNIGCGVVAYLFAIPVLRCRTGLFSMGLLFGYIYGNILGLLVVVTNDLVGPSALGDAFGCVMLTNGIGTLLGPPLAGAVIDSFKSPIPGIYIASCILIVGGLIMSVVPFHKYIMSKHRRK